uniref:5'-nucleotidase n=1 Tax=Ditylum brightwellii TaxID=49249 RepID=A0A7S4QX41_9STRA
MRKLNHPCHNAPLLTAIYLMAAASSSSFNTRVMAFVVPYPKLTSLSSPLKNIPSVPSKYCPPTTTCAISRTRINTRKATHLNLKASTIDVDAYMGDDYNTRYITQYDDTDATLPRHVTNEDVNNIITKAEKVIQDLQKTASALQDQMEVERLNQSSLTLEEEEDDVERDDDVVFANSYVDLGKVDTVGFDYDYTLVTYTNELLELIYDMALKRLVEEKQYPSEMLDAGLKFDPNFSIRGKWFVHCVCFCIFFRTNYNIYLSLSFSFRSCCRS